MRLELISAAFGWRAGTPLFENLSLSVETPSVLSVLGPNGAGKTSLLRCILGFEKWTAGRLLIDGEDASAIEASRFWKRIGYVSQAKSAAFSYTVEETVLMGRSAHIGLFGKPSTKDKEAAERAMLRAGVIDLRSKLCNELSGGQYQMVLVARALAAEPELLVMDEPESNLDFKNRLRVLQCIEELADEGVGTIINTHYPEHALRLADRALVMIKGEHPVFGNAADVLTEEILSRSFGVQVKIFTNDAGRPEKVRTVAAL